MFSAAQQTSTAKLLVFSPQFKKRARGLRVNVTEPETENAFNGDHFGFGLKSKAKSDKWEKF